MNRFHIDLLEGFTGDRVVVHVDGRLAFRGDGIRTDYSVGLARRIEAETEGDEAEVTVEVPDRGLRSRARHVLDGDARVAVRITADGDLEQETSRGVPELY